MSITTSQTKPIMNGRPWEETELLIDLVREQPHLFDTRHPDYKDAVKKGEAWRAIGEQLLQTSDAVRVKWKNLRDSYVKHQKFLRGDRSLAKFKTWPWAPNLEFLSGVVLLRPSLRHNIAESATEAVDPLDDNSDDPDPDYQMPPPPKKPKVDRLPSSCPSENKGDTQKKHLDRIDYLFLSYAETFKKFSSRTQALLKMDMAQMFGQAELRETADDAGVSAESPWQTSSFFPEDDTDDARDSSSCSSFVQVKLE